MAECLDRSIPTIFHRDHEVIRAVRRKRVGQDRQRGSECCWSATELQCRMVHFMGDRSAIETKDQRTLLLDPLLKHDGFSGSLLGSSIGSNTPRIFGKSATPYMRQ